jgi:hypothetical protein
VIEFIQEKMSMQEECKTPVVPRECGGKWIAWNFERTKILATGRTYSDAKQAAEALGETKPVLAKAPRADIRFLGDISICLNVM